MPHHTQPNNPSGLVVGAPVRLAGVDIGIVQSIHFESNARLTLGKVQRHVLLKAVMRSAIRSEGLKRETAAQKP